MRKNRSIPIKDGKYWGFVPMGAEYNELSEKEQKYWLKFILSNSTVTDDLIEMGRKCCIEEENKQ